MRAYNGMWKNGGKAVLTGETEIYEEFFHAQALHSVQQAYGGSVVVEIAFRAASFSSQSMDLIFICNLWM